MEEEFRMSLSPWKALTTTSEQVTASLDDLSLRRECLFSQSILFGLKITRQVLETSYGEPNSCLMESQILVSFLGFPVETLESKVLSLYFLASPLFR